MDEKQAATSRSDGLEGEWLSLEEVKKLDFFQGTDRDFKIKLNANFGTRPPSKQQGDAATPSPEPGIKAAVKRHYQTGDIICKAGEYGSTAFLILAGSAVAEVPAASSPAAIRSPARALDRFKSMFKRRTRRSDAAEPGEPEVGEYSAFASVSCDRPPPRRHLGPGDFFGIDTCINHYPREATVRAEQDCTVLEMLRSLVDSVRAYGDSAAQVSAVYRDNATQTELALSSLSRGLDEGQMQRLIAACQLLTNDSPQIHNGVVYSEGDAADMLYLVRAGNIKLTRSGPNGDFVFAYLGRGSVFGFEGLVAQDESARPLELRCPSHPQQFAARDIGAGLSIGRNPSCDFVFPREQRSVSRQHCRIEPRGDELVLVQGSTQSVTLLNGEPIAEAVVVAGDRITIADYTFELSYAAPQPGAAEALPLRRATATGLDNFEIIKIDRKELEQLATESEALFATIRSAAHSLRTAAAPSLRPSPGVTDELLRLDLYNSQNVLLIDLDRCTRCDECVRACADAHGGVTRFTRDGPRFGKYLVTMACRSCTDPKCMIGCPVGSIRRESSLEIRIEDWCIGCQSCAKQCPFGNINMVSLLDESVAPAPAAASDSPIDLHTGSMRAVVCDLCAGYDGPNCVYACPHDAAIRVNPAAYLAAEDLR